MKKIFSAFLLMTMMVASVGSFVSCSDIEESIAAVDEATKDNAAAVEALKGEIAALKTALATAQADAAAAKTEANAAKQAAATAKAEAIAAALAEIEKVNGDVDAMQAAIDSINAALTGKADKATVELLQATIDEYKALIDANGAASTANAAAIAALEEALAALGENVTPEQLAEVVAKMEAIDAALIAFQSRIQSVAYVPQTASTNAPKAMQYTVGNEKTDYIIQLAYQVSPVSAAAELEDAEVYVKGIAVKAEAPAKFETKVLSVDEKTGMVEVVAYIPEETVKAENYTHVVVALAVENENGVEITSTYEEFKAESHPLADDVIIKDFDVAADGTMSYTYEMPFDTAIADSKVELINPEFIVDGGIFEETPLAEALEYLGLEDVEIEMTPVNRFGKSYVTINTEPAKYNNGTATAPAVITVLKATQSDDKKNVTAEFSADYAKVTDAKKLIDKYLTVTLKEGFFTLAGDRLPQTTIKYEVVGKKVPATIEIADIDTPWVPYPIFYDIAYSGITQADFNNYHTATVDIVDADDNKNGKATILATSHDDMKVTLTGFTWPKETTTYTVKHEFKSEADKNAVTTVWSYEFTITVEGRPENVEYEFAPETLPTLDLTPAYDLNNPEDLDRKDPVEDLASPVVVGTIVTDITEEYADFYEENVLAGLISGKLEAADWKVYVLDVNNDKLVDSETTDTDNKITPIDLEEVEGKPGVMFDYVAATDTDPEKSQFVFPYSVKNYKALKGKAIQIVATLTGANNVNGVDYDIRVNVQVGSWSVPEFPGVGLVKGKFNASTLKGVNPITWSKYPFTWTENMINSLGATVPVNHTYYVELPTSSTAYNFYNKTTGLKLSDYVELANIPTADLNLYTIRITMSGAPTYPEVVGTETVNKFFYYTNADAKDEIPYIQNTSMWGANKPLFESVAVSEAAKVENVPYNDGKVNLAKVTAAAAGERNTAVILIDAEHFGNTYVFWNDSRDNEFTLNVELIKARRDNQYINRLPAIDVEPVVFHTDSAIQSFEPVVTEAYEYKHGEDLVINLAEHINVTDLFDQQVNNTYGDWTTVWANYKWIPNADADADYDGEYAVGGVPQLFKVYEQEISFAYLENKYGEKLDYKVTNTLGLKSPNHFEFNEANGTITIKQGLSNLTGEGTTFTVGVELTHMHDGYKPVYKEITFQVVNAQ